jgi:hypothetical protein
MKETLLIIWIIAATIESCFFVGGSVYLAIWKHCSGWWVVLGLVLSLQISLYKCLRSHFNARMKDE